MLAAIDTTELDLTERWRGVSSRERRTVDCAAADGLRTCAASSRMFNPHTEVVERGWLAKTTLEGAARITEDRGEAAKQSPSRCAI